MAPDTASIWVVSESDGAFRLETKVYLHCQKVPKRIDSTLVIDITISSSYLNAQNSLWEFLFTGATILHTQHLFRLR